MSVIDTLHIYVYNENYKSDYLDIENPVTDIRTDQTWNRYQNIWVDELTDEVIQCKYRPSFKCSIPKESPETRDNETVPQRRKLNNYWTDNWNA